MVPGYKMKKLDAIHLHELFSGKYAPLFWFAQLGGLIIPIILLLFRSMRKPLPAMIISLFVIAGAWLKRYLIVIPTMQHSFLPIQHVPLKFQHYSPTLIEMAITAASFILVLIIITVLSKLFPILPIYEMTEDHNDE
jgi:molybdopterin-containing oxidoreductase family membrane subunit